MELKFLRRIARANKQPVALPLERTCIRWDDNLRSEFHRLSYDPRANDEWMAVQLSISPTSVRRERKRLGITYRN